MKNNASIYNAFARLTAAAVFPVILVTARSIYVGQLTATFLLWNLFLAWLPLLFAALAVVTARRSLLLALLPGLAWLMFLPNAPYMVTDLMHLSYDGRVPVLFDEVEGVRPSRSRDTLNAVARRRQSASPRAGQRILRYRTWLGVSSGDWMIR